MQNVEQATKPVSETLAASLPANQSGMTPSFVPGARVGPVREAPDVVFGRVPAGSADNESADNERTDALSAAGEFTTDASAKAAHQERAAQILQWNDSGLLADVVGFETDEVARATFGTTVETYRGETYIDFTGGIAVHACGHNHPDIVAAVQAQAARTLHVSDILRHVPQLELAAWMRRLFDMVFGSLPAPLPGSLISSPASAPADAAPDVAPAPASDTSLWTFLFMNSGSESIDAAAKLALKATGRSKLLAFEGAFHGRTLLASALSRSKTLHWNAYEEFLAPLRANILHAPAPRCAGCELIRSADQCCANGLERMLEQHGSDIAGVFLEAQQGEGGYVPMSPRAAQKIRALTRKYGILLIADEIQSGWGRTGKWFGFEHLGIAPDVVVFGKAVGGGLPLAGVAARHDLMDRWQPGEHGTTFGGNPLACAAGLAALQIIARDGLVEHAAMLGDAIKARLRPLVGHNGVADVRGNGLMLGIELRGPSGKPDYARCDAAKLLARASGLLLLTCGAKIGNPYTDNAALRLIPPLNTPLAVAHHAVDILIDALQRTNATG